MNNGQFGPGMMSRLYHQQRQPMQGQMQPMQQQMRQQMPGGQASLGGMINAFQQHMGAGQQRQGGMDAIIAQLMKRRGG